MKAFFHMGGYAAYVWTCVGLTLAVFAWNISSARSLHARSRERALQRAAGGKGTR